MQMWKWSFEHVGVAEYPGSCVDSLKSIGI